MQLFDALDTEHLTAQLMCVWAHVTLCVLSVVLHSSWTFESGAKRSLELLLIWQ